MKAKLKSMLKKVWGWLKSLPKLLWKVLKSRPFLVFGFILTWIVPILLLNEQFTLIELFVKEPNKWIVISGVGYVVLAVLLLKLKGRIAGAILKIKNVFVGEILRTIHRLIEYGFVFATIWLVGVFADKLLNWWIYAGISMLCGAIMYIIDKYYYNKKNLGE